MYNSISAVETIAPIVAKSPVKAADRHCAGLAAKSGTNAEIGFADELQKILIKNPF